MLWATQRSPFKSGRDLVRLCSKGLNAVGNTAGSLQERQGTGGVLRRRLAGRLLLGCGCKHMSNSTFPQCTVSSMPNFLQHADDLGQQGKADLQSTMPNVSACSHSAGQPSCGAAA